MPTYGHQFMPTYPKLQPSYVEGVLQARMEIFNSREDIEYYEFSVHDKNWERIPFATAERILYVPYLKRTYVDIFIKQQDKNRAVYICSMSKILAGVHQSTVVSSKICSKLK
jgi:hypothetical protein